MELATYVGISILDFWELSPFELDVAVKSFNRRKNDEIEEYKIKLENERMLLTVQAYQISRWVWQKHVDIDKALNVKKEQKVMTDNDMLNQVKALNKLFGGEVENSGNEE